MVTSDHCAAQTHSSSLGLGDTSHHHQSPVSQCGFKVNWGWCHDLLMNCVECILVSRCSCYQIVTTADSATAAQEINWEIFGPGPLVGVMMMSSSATCKPRKALNRRTCVLYNLIRAAHPWNLFCSATSHKTFKRFYHLGVTFSLKVPSSPGCIASLIKLCGGVLGRSI